MRRLVLLATLAAACSAEELPLPDGSLPSGDTRRADDDRDPDDVGPLPGDPSGDPEPTGDPSRYPIAVIAPVGSPVAPLSTVVLDASDSTTPSGSVHTYAWTLTKPDTSTAALEPPGGVSPSLHLDLPGTYGIELVVAEDSGRSSAPATASVTATPTEVLWVQVVWSTPGDPDPTDETGADLAVHLRHPSAVGIDIDGDTAADGWFDAVYDCNQDNPTPDWGAAGTANDPAILLEDSDGAGPEVLGHGVPGDGSHRLGVYYRDDAGFGTSSVTVRAWVDGNLVFEVDNVALEPLDFWRVADIVWPSGAITPVTVDSIVPNVSP
jgi:hypothetical protein